MADSPLSGVGVLVTRPTAQAGELVTAIEENGGRAICFPVIEIVARGTEAVAADAELLPPPDIAIFVSSNAVAHGIGYSADASKAAIGPATAAAIRSAGHFVDIAPVDGHDSESLLAEPALRHVADKNIRIIRGSDGRQLLAHSLRERGANVDYLSVYERRLPEISAESLERVENAARHGEISVITVMSIETLSNLLRALPASLAELLANVPLVTPATRVIKDVLDRFPASRPVLASGTQAADMIEAIIEIHKNDPGPAA